MHFIMDLPFLLTFSTIVVVVFVHSGSKWTECDSNLATFMAFFHSFVQEKTSQDVTRQAKRSENFIHSFIQKFERCISRMKNILNWFYHENALDTVCMNFERSSIISRVAHRVSERAKVRISSDIETIQQLNY